MKIILERTIISLATFISYGRERGHVTELLIWWTVSVAVGLAIGTVKIILS